MVYQMTQFLSGAHGFAKNLHGFDPPLKGHDAAATRRAVERSRSEWEKLGWSLSWPFFIDQKWFDPAILWVHFQSFFVGRVIVGVVRFSPWWKTHETGWGGCHMQLDFQFFGDGFTTYPTDSYSI